MSEAPSQAPGVRALPDATGVLPIALAGLAYAALVLQAPRLLRDPDVYFHPAVGRWILAHQAVPTTDTFSHTLHGAPWTAHEWLGQLLFALAYDIGGWTLLVALTGASTALALYLLARHLVREVPARYAVLFVALALMLVATHLHARVHALAAPCLVALLVELAVARGARRAPRFAFLLVVALWANLHGSVSLAAILVFAFGAEAVTDAPDAVTRAHAVRTWGAFLVLCLVAMCLTPQGLGGLTYAWRMEGDSAAFALINEWRPPDLRTLHPLHLWLLAFVGGGIAWRVRVPWLRLALLAAFVFFALRRARYGEILGLVSPVLVASALRVALLARAQAVPNTGAHVPTSSRHRIAHAIVAALVVASTLVVVSLGLARPARAITPDAALATVRGAHVAGPVLNAYAFGGYLMAHDVPTFVDGRSDLYGAAFLTAYVSAIVGGDAPTLERLLARHDIRWTLLPPTAPGVRALDALPAWRRLYADDIAVVHVREARP